MGPGAHFPPMRKIPIVGSWWSHITCVGLENRSVLEKELVFCVCLRHLSSISHLISVEAHSPFVQCVAWASSPPSEVEGESDRILNVVATGGTDKVREKKMLSFCHYQRSFLLLPSWLKSGGHRGHLLSQSSQTNTHCLRPWIPTRRFPLSFPIHYFIA